MKEPEMTFDPVEHPDEDGAEQVVYEESDEGSVEDVEVDVPVLTVTDVDAIVED